MLVACAADVGLDRSAALAMLHSAQALRQLEQQLTGAVAGDGSAAVGGAEEAMRPGGCEVRRQGLPPLCPLFHMHPATHVMYSTSRVPGR